MSEIAERVDALVSIAEEIRTIAERPAESGSIHDPLPIGHEDEPVSDAHLIVGYAEGEAGSHVDVHISVGSPEPISGWGMYIGCSPALKLTSAAETEQLRSLFSLITNPEDSARQLDFGNERSQFIAHFVSFFQFVSNADDVKALNQALIELDALKKLADVAQAEEIATAELRVAQLKARVNARTIEYKPIPPMTKCYRLTFKIPAGVPPGTVFLLENRSWYYGRPYKSASGVTKYVKLHNLLTNKAQGIQPQLVSGWVKVVE